MGGPLKQWITKFIEQFESNNAAKDSSGTPPLNEDKATLLFLLDTYNKTLFEIEKNPTRKTRAEMDEYIHSLLKNTDSKNEKIYFKIRQFFQSYRIEESTYVQKSFDDFKKIIWDFADQLADDENFEKKQESEIHKNLAELRDAVESNSIDILRAKSKEFIQVYVEKNQVRTDRRKKNLSSVRKNLSTIKKQLLEAHKDLETDHLTGAYNRRSFELHLKKLISLSSESKVPPSLIMVDIDHFKKVNDSYGHDIGDLVLKECIHLMQEFFCSTNEFVARLGGEEFVILVNDSSMEQITQKIDAFQNKLRKEVFIMGKFEIKFTVSLGIAQLLPGENGESLLKRADLALYQSKNSGRNRWTLANNEIALKVVS